MKMKSKLILVIAIVSTFIGCTPDDHSQPVPDNSSSSVVEKDHSEPTQGAETLTAATAEPQDRQEPSASLTGCASSRFFTLYAREKAIQASDETSLVLDVPVDLHEADCGAPDCYGHSMTLTLKLRRVGKRCEIESAKASAVPFRNCDTQQDQEALQPWTNNFVVKGAPDLSDDHLTQIELRDFGRSEALLLLPRGYYFYENADASSQLHPKLWSVDTDDSKDCCYGYTSSATRSWSLDPQE